MRFIRLKFTSGFFSGRGGFELFRVTAGDNITAEVPLKNCRISNIIYVLARTVLLKLYNKMHTPIHRHEVPAQHLI